MLDVIIPVYNRSHLIRKALDSIFASSYKSFKVIVVDDGSTDNLENEIKDYPISFIRLEENGGNPGLVADIGIKSSMNPYITVVDSDDWISEDALECLMSEFDKDPSLDLVYSHRINILDNNVWQLHSASCSPYKKENMLKFTCISQLCIYTRKLYTDVGGFDLNFKYASDYELYIRMAATARVKKVPKNLYFCNRKSTHISQVISETDKTNADAAMAQEKNRGIYG